MMPLTSPASHYSRMISVFHSHVCPPHPPLPFFILTSRPAAASAAASVPVLSGQNKGLEFRKIAEKFAV